MSLFKISYVILYNWPGCPCQALKKGASRNFKFRNFVSIRQYRLGFQRNFCRVISYTLIMLPNRHELYLASYLKVKAAKVFTPTTFQTLDLWTRAYNLSSSDATKFNEIWASLIQERGIEHEDKRKSRLINYSKNNVGHYNTFVVFECVIIIGKKPFEKLS